VLSEFVIKIITIAKVKVKGTKESPWELKTPSGSSEYIMYKDDTVDPAILVCKVGSTTLHYQWRAIDDLHAMLKKHKGWMELGYS
jgi:hypothetical protein